MCTRNHTWQLLRDRIHIYAHAILQQILFLKTVHTLLIRQNHKKEVSHIQTTYCKFHIVKTILNLSINYAISWILKDVPQAKFHHVSQSICNGLKFDGYDTSSLRICSILLMSSHPMRTITFVLKLIKWLWCHWPSFFGSSLSYFCRLDHHAFLLFWMQIQRETEFPIMLLQG